MSPLYEGIPAVLYSGLWVLKVYRKLEKTFPNSIKMAILLTDSPPAFLVKIDRGEFEIKLLDNINKTEDLDNVECDTYLALPTEILYKGAVGIRDGFASKEVIVKNPDALIILAKLTGYG